MAASTSSVLAAERNGVEGDLTLRAVLDSVSVVIDPMKGDPIRLAGESVETCCSSVYYMISSTDGVLGDLYVTNFRIIFVPQDREEYPTAVSIPNLCIYKAEKVGGKSSRGEFSYAIDVKCKDFRSIRFCFSPLQNKRPVVFNHLKSKMHPNSESELFAFNFSHTYNDAEDGWCVWNTHDEFARQGVLDTGLWKIVDINLNFEICDSYPPYLCVPASTSSEELLRVAEFRSKGRIPILCWSSPTTLGSISRCSQPLVGVFRSECKEDQTLLSAFCQTAAPDWSDKMLVLDLRPKMNAMANQAFRGAGYEKTSHYRDIELQFCNMENIHAISDSFQKIMNLTLEGAPKDRRWYRRIDETYWFDHLHLILDTTKVVVDAVVDGRAVLVHCSDGWDRTSQVCSLAQLCLDPFYRSIRGFCILVEKEWLATGHKFHERIAHGFKNWNHDQSSPIFLQFIDCVYQMIVQYPYAFEFDERLLIFILDELYACRFGTFLGDTLKHRLQISLPDRTHSIWTHILKFEDMFFNPLFVPPGVAFKNIDPKNPIGVLNIDTSVSSLRLFSSYYWRFVKQIGVEGQLGVFYSQRVLMSAKLRSLNADSGSRLSMTEQDHSLVRMFQDEIHVLSKKYLGCVRLLLDLQSMMESSSIGIPPSIFTRLNDVLPSKEEMELQEEQDRLNASSEGKLQNSSHEQLVVPSRIVLLSDVTADSLLDIRQDTASPRLNSLSLGNSSETELQVGREHPSSSPSRHQVSNPSPRPTGIVNFSPSVNTKLEDESAISHVRIQEDYFRKPLHG